MKTAREKRAERHWRAAAQGPMEPFVQMTSDEMQAAMERMGRGGEVCPYASAFRNNRYIVLVSYVATDWGRVTHLWIRRTDGQRVREWGDLQQIKDEVTGSSRCAVEVFPPREQLVDEAHMAHLWVLPHGFDLPFTLRGRGSPA